ncbi:MAG: TonB family protein [Flavihumibacter sp.]
MSPENILRSDALDILFENRNKQYGAYELRKHYDNRLAYGLMGMALLAGLFLVVAFWKKQPQGPITFTLPVVDTIRLASSPELPVPEPPKPVAPQQQVATVKNPPPVIVPDDQVDKTEVPAIDELAGKRIGTGNIDGPEPGDLVEPPAVAGTGAGSEPAPPAPPAPEEPRNSASVMPGFPGGEGALQRWLSRNLRPQEGQEEGQRVKVVVRFVVGPTGVIDRIQLVQEGGEPYDNEVLRVVKKMPAWKPGIQDGRPVAVWFTIPIIFETGL